MEKAGNLYVHGYSDREIERLVDQGDTLADLLHHDTRYPAGASVLEAGCGVGAQTVSLVKNSPGAFFTCVDISEESLRVAKARVEKAGGGKVSFRQADIFALDFPDQHFDHIFVCFVLEHLKNPLEALLYLKSKLKEGGSMTVIEGDHGSTFFHPDSLEAKRAIRCLVECQARIGGDALIGRRLYPLLRGAGFENPCVSPRMVYVDASRPGYVEGFTKNTFTAMVEGVREQAIGSGMIDLPTWEKGIGDLYRTTEADGTFCYTFFKGVARR